MKKKPTKKRKDPVAVALGKKRWRGVPSKKRSEIMTKVIRARWSKRPSE